MLIIHMLMSNKYPNTMHVLRHFGHEYSYVGTFAGHEYSHVMISCTVYLSINDTIQLEYACSISPN